MVSIQAIVDDVVELVTEYGADVLSQMEVHDCSEDEAEHVRKVISQIADVVAVYSWDTVLVDED